jgi:hypothetical protein
VESEESDPVAERPDTDAYEVPVDPHDDVDCEDCQ